VGGPARVFRDRDVFDVRYKLRKADIAATATTNCRNVKKVLAMWVSSTVMAWMASATGI
jgi:hypothetical protein